MYLFGKPLTWNNALVPAPPVLEKCVPLRFSDITSCKKNSLELFILSSLITDTSLPTIPLDCKVLLGDITIIGISFDKEELFMKKK